MKELSDEEIQRLLDGELHPAEEPGLINETENLKQYRFLFEKLKEEPEQGLPYNFAAKVKNRLQAQLNRKKDIRFYAISFIALIAGFAVFYELLAYVNATAGHLFITVAFKYKWIVILGSVLFLGVLYCDQKLVKERPAES